MVTYSQNIKNEQVTNNIKIISKKRYVRRKLFEKKQKHRHFKSRSIINCFDLSFMGVNWICGNNVAYSRHYSTIGRRTGGNIVLFAEWLRNILFVEDNGTKKW